MHNRTTAGRKAIIYCRTATTAQDIVAQQDRCRTYAQEKKL